MVVDGSHVVREQGAIGTSVKELAPPGKRWGSYTLSARVKPLSIASSTGIAGRYQNAGDGYVLLLRNGDSWYLGKRVKGLWTTLANGTLSYSPHTWHTLSLTFIGTSITAAIDTRPVAQVADRTFSAGSVSLTTRTSAEFDDVRILPG